MYEYEFESGDLKTWLRLHLQQIRYHRLRCDCSNAIEKFKEVKELIDDIIKELEKIEPDD